MKIRSLLALAASASVAVAHLITVPTMSSNAIDLSLVTARIGSWDPIMHPRAWPHIRGTTSRRPGRLIPCVATRG